MLWSKLLLLLLLLLLLFIIYLLDYHPKTLVLPPLHRRDCLLQIDVAPAARQQLSLAQRRVSPANNHSHHSAVDAPVNSNQNIPAGSVCLTEDGLV